MSKFHIFNYFKTYLNYVMNLMTIGAGCFGVLRQFLIKSVTNVTSGYSGGTHPNPNYEIICTGRSGHAEVIQFEFDEEIVSYEELL